jgi:HCOMODA/2-hydroxy-3-carboxy-muconic semialdehyde decarboxylase
MRALDPDRKEGSISTGCHAVSEFKPMKIASAEEEHLVREAARALGGAGLVHAYGHCSMRLDQVCFLACAPMPMALIGEEPGSVVPIVGPLPDGVLGEVRVHQAIYARRPDINGICRIMPPALMALSTQGVVPRPRHGLGAYFGSALPFWEDPRLLRSEATANSVADRLGLTNAIIMRGNGAVVAADSIEKAVVFSWFLEDSARIEREVRAMGFSPDAGLLSAEEVVARQVFSGQVVERMWMWLTRSISPAEGSFSSEDPYC